LFEICDKHLRRVLDILRPDWLIGIGGFATERGRIVSEGMKIQPGRILHPSPASPAANRGWSKSATRQLVRLGVWK
jgi:single-strand selective monofunctional uracil DNA glycosylase